MVKVEVDAFTAKELEKMYDDLARFERIYHSYREKDATRRALATVRGALLGPIFQLNRVEEKTKTLKKHDPNKLVGHSKIACFLERYAAATDDEKKQVEQHRRRHGLVLVRKGQAAYFAYAETKEKANDDGP